MHLWQWAVLLAALSPFAYYALAIYCGWDYFRAARKMPALDLSFTPPVSILKPVRGVDREAYENFASFCQLDYPAYEIVFAVGSPKDEAVPIIEKLQRDFPKRGIRLLIGVPRAGANNKVSQLCRLVREASHETLAISDSDTRVEPDYLREMVAPLARPGTGAVTAFFRGMAGESFCSRLAGLGVPAESAPSALIARKLERKMKFAFGWSIATTKKILGEIGGFEAIADHHSDDFELGNRIASKGYSVELMRKCIWMVFPNDTLMEFLSHELRWSIGLRNVRKAGYWGLILTFGLPWAVLAAIAAPSWVVAAGYLIAYLFLRLAMAWTVGVWGIGDPLTRRNIWLVPLRDAANFAIWLAGFFSNTIRWRGLIFQVKNGMLIPLADAKDTQVEGQKPFFKGISQ